MPRTRETKEYICACGKKLLGPPALSAHLKQCLGFWDAVGKIIKAFEDRAHKSITAKKWGEIKPQDMPTSYVLQRQAGGWEEARLLAGRPPACHILPPKPLQWRGLLQRGENVSKYTEKDLLYNILIGMVEVAQLEADRKFSHWGNQLAEEDEPALVESAEEFLNFVKSVYRPGWENGHQRKGVPKVSGKPTSQQGQPKGEGRHQEGRQEAQGQPQGRRARDTQCQQPTSR